MRFFGSRGLAAPTDAWQDHVFSHALPFYLFDLPFYSDLLGFVFVLAILCAVLFWVTARGWQLVERFRYGQLLDGPSRNVSLGSYLRLPGATRVPFVRVMAVILLLGFAAWVYLGNYRAAIQVSRLHDRRRLRGRKNHAASALAADYLRLGGAASGVAVEVQAGGRPGVVLFHFADCVAGRRSRCLRAAQ